MSSGEIDYDDQNNQNLSEKAMQGKTALRVTYVTRLAGKLSHLALN
jgi:hypothetical protein